MIKDSGHRYEFDTGAVRDVHEGKGRCDLLPLGILSIHMKDQILGYISEFQYYNKPSSLWNALDKFIGREKCRWADGMLEVAKHYEEGAKKYSDRNWEKGIPLHHFIDSGVRHYLKWLRGDKDESHDLAFVWNILGAIWTYQTHPELNDNPGK